MAESVGAAQQTPGIAVSQFWLLILIVNGIDK